MVRISVELSVPGLKVGVSDIRTEFKRKNSDAGPFLIAARACGLALDTAFGSEPGDKPHLWALHAMRHQLWYLRPSGVKNEVLIVSAANGLALDSTTDTSGGISPVMWEQHAETWQRWRLEGTPDGVGYLIQSAHSRQFLTVNEDAQPRWNPWFEERHGRLAQQ